MAINEEGIAYHKAHLKPNGIVLINKDEKNKETDNNIFHLPLERLAKEAGGVIATNTVGRGGSACSPLGLRLKILNRC